MRIAPVVLAPVLVALVAGLPSSRLAPTAHAQAPGHLWVLQEPDAIIEYDPATFAARRTLKLPRRVIEHPEGLSINAKGQMIFLPAAGARWEGGDLASSGDRMWFWDGRQAREWDLVRPVTEGGSALGPTVTETVLQSFLSAGGESLFWFENSFEYREGKATRETGPNRSVRASARVWRTDLAGGRKVSVATVARTGWCRCQTGACSETCPEWELWAPDGAVGDFFVMTRVTPGQLSTIYHESVLYRRSGNTWHARPLPQAAERLFTASATADALVGRYWTEGVAVGTTRAATSCCC